MGMIACPNLALLALNEAEITHGKSFDMSNIDILPSHVRESLLANAKKEGIDEKKFRALIATNGDKNDARISLHGKDPMEGLYMHELEKYDKAQDEAILASNNIVESYNALLEGHLDKALQYTKKFIAICETYDTDKENASDELSSLRSVYRAQGMSAAVTYMKELMDDQEELGLTDSDIKKIVCDAIYQPSDNPDEIRKIVKSRIAYNNTIIALFKQMLQINYSLLGMTKDEALLLSQKLESSNQDTKIAGIKELKAAVMDNENNFRNGNTWDFRKVGGGCLFITEEADGTIESFNSIDRMLQMVMTYDAIVVGHGGSHNEKAVQVYARRIKDIEKYFDNEEELFDKEVKELNKLVDARYDEIVAKQIKDENKYLALLKQIRHDQDVTYKHFIARKQELEKKAIEAEKAGNSELADKYKALIENLRKSGNARFAEYKKTLDDIKDKAIKNHTRLTYVEARVEYSETFKNIEDKHNERLEKIREQAKIDEDKADKEFDRISRKFANESRWTIDPVKTLRAGPFTDVNDLLRQLIKEGFKNICLISCNPGHHQLAKDIREAKDVKITHSENVLLAENATDWYDPWYNTIETLALTESHMMSVCKEFDILYGDDDYLDECICYFETGSSNTLLVEGVASSVWAKIKEYIKKAIGFIVGIFKKLIDLFKKLIQKIKDFFKKIVDGKKIKNDFVKNINSSAILVENARVNKYSAKSWEQMQKEIISACETISKNIQITEEKQTKNMQELEKYADKQAKTVNESSNPKMDSLLALLL